MNKDKQQKTGAKCGRWGSLAALLLLDVGVLALTTGSVVLLRHVMGGAFSPSFYFSLGWLLGLFPCIALSLGVYSDYLTPPHEELRLLSWSTSLFFLAIGSLVFMSHDATRYSRSIFFFSWVFSLFSLPLARAVAKKTLRHLFSWKYPCVIIGDRRRVQPLLLDIQRHMPSLDPVAVVTGEEQGTFATEFGPLPLVPLSKVEALSTRHPDCHAILAHAATGPTCASQPRAAARAALPQHPLSSGRLSGTPALAFGRGYQGNDIHPKLLQASGFQTKPSQTGNGHHPEPALPGDSPPSCRMHRPWREMHKPRPHTFPPDARGPGWKAHQDHQIQNHVLRCRKAAEAAPERKREAGPNMGGKPETARRTQESRP